MEPLPAFPLLSEWGSLQQHPSVTRAIVPHSSPANDPLQTAAGVYVTVHGHFYQPPRENPYLDAVERQPSAYPSHDWNERIHHECYRPNAFARVLNERGDIVGIVNNYEYMSFNIGATLMTWLERYDVEVYQRILEADRRSCDRLNGHGNAIAQVYNHIIMPLANERDKYTQIRWGKTDFRSRFGRDPEGMWLAEAAVDYATLEALIAEGIKFIVLAPSQALRCRSLFEYDADRAWQEVGGGQIDPTRPYRCFLGTDSTAFIDIFFYDGPISGDMGFSDVVYNSYHFAGRIAQAVRGDHRSCQLISVATDGETFGHHKRGTEKTLAYAFLKEFPQRGWTVTNYAHYLSLNPPSWEVELKPVTAWSCAHGVDRWQEDCGCGGGGGWHQKWRRPLRDALDWLRDQLIKVYEESGKSLFRDPWLARDEYIQVMGDRSPAHVEKFLARHRLRKLTGAEQVDALRLLEMQRHALLMYTSCGWFFEELSRLEGVQILRYAARALELAGDVAAVQLEKGFVRRLSLAPSNVESFKHGATVYKQLVLSAQINLEQVAAHYAISSLFTTYPQQHQIYCYTARQQDYQLQRVGALTVAMGQLQLTSEITWEQTEWSFAVLHLGGWDFHCCIQPFGGRRGYGRMKEELFSALHQGSAAQTIEAMNQNFDGSSFNLQNLFAEERYRIMGLLTQETLLRLNQLYSQVYRNNYSVLMAFRRDGMPVPQELQAAAEITLSHRVLAILRSLEQETASPANETSVMLRPTLINELESVAIESHHLQCQLNLSEVKPALEKLILQSLWQILHDFNPQVIVTAVQQLERLIDIGHQLNVSVSLDRVQELYFHRFHSRIAPLCLGWLQRQMQQNQEASSSCSLLEISSVKQLLRLGQRLAIDVNPWLRHLEMS